MNDNDHEPKSEQSTEMNDPWSTQPTESRSHSPDDGTMSIPSTDSATQQEANDSVPVESHTPITVSAPQPYAAPPQPVMVPGQPVAPGAMPQENPGQTLGIVSIVLGVLMIWIVGLPLAIVSMVKSAKVGASKTLGIVGLVLNILSALGSVFVILVMLISLPALQRNAQKAQSDYNAAVQASTAIPLSQNYTPANPEVSFSLPATISGWTTTSVDKDGITEFTKADDSATFMTYHGKLAGMTGSDEEVTQTAMAEYITQLDAVEVSNSESTISFPCQSDGKMLEFETKQVTATSNGRAIKGIVAVRMYEGHELSVIYLATSDAFSMSEWYDLTDQVEVKDGA